MPAPAIRPSGAPGLSPTRPPLPNALGGSAPRLAGQERFALPAPPPRPRQQALPLAMAPQPIQQQPAIPYNPWAEQRMLNDAMLAIGMAGVTNAR